MMGPTQGAQTMPMPAPTAIPGSSPFERAPTPDPRRPSGARRDVSQAPSTGTARHVPRVASTSALAVRNWPVESPAVANSEARRTESSTKLAPNPSTMPTARRPLPPLPTPSTSGTTGSVQGATIVSRPAMKANVRRSSMRSLP